MEEFKAAEMIRLVDSDVSDETDIYMTSLCDARYVDWTLEFLGDYCVEHVLMTHLCELIQLTSGCQWPLDELLDLCLRVRSG